LSACDSMLTEDGGRKTVAFVLRLPSFVQKI